MVKLLWLAITGIEDKHARERAVAKEKTGKSKSSPSTARLIEGQRTIGWCEAHIVSQASLGKHSVHGPAHLRLGNFLALTFKGDPLLALRGDPLQNVQSVTEPDRAESQL